MSDPIQVLRGTVADTQDVLSAPDVDRAMAALAQVEALVGTLKQTPYGSPQGLDDKEIAALDKALRPFEDNQ